MALDQQRWYDTRNILKQYWCYQNSNIMSINYIIVYEEIMNVQKYGGLRHQFKRYFYNDSRGISSHIGEGILENRALFWVTKKRVILKKNLERSWNIIIKNSYGIWYDYTFSDCFFTALKMEPFRVNYLK